MRDWYEMSIVEQAARTWKLCVDRGKSKELILAAHVIQNLAQKVSDLERKLDRLDQEDI